MIIVLVVATSLPHAIGWARQTNGDRYLGRIPSNPYDSSAYFSDIEQAAQGRWLFSNQLTSEQQQPTLFHPIWLMAGWFEVALHSDAAIAFHLVRILALAAFVIVLDIFLGQWFSSSGERWLALFLITTSSGLGWLFTRNVYIENAVLRAPIDIWVDESNTFRTMGHSAQFIVAQMFLLGVVWAAFQLTQNERRDWHRWVGPAITLLGFFHPYDLITAVAVSGAWYVFWAAVYTPDRKFMRSVALTLIQWWTWAIPVAAYYLVGPLQQVAVSGWFSQNITLTPAPWVVLLGYGLMVPLAVVGIVVGRKKKPAPVAFLACWIVVVMVAMYTPGLNIQRRLLSGLHLPIAVLTAIGLFWLVSRSAPKGGHRRLAITLVVFLSTTNAQYVRSVSQHVVNPDRWDADFYASGDMARVSDWLRAHSAQDDVVLGNRDDSNILVGLTGRPVAFAHSSQTVDYQKRKLDWQTFIQAATPATVRADIIRRLRIRWLYWTPPDAAKGGYEPLKDPAWSVAYRSGSVILFQARR